MKTGGVSEQIWDELQQFIVTYVTRNQTEVMKLHTCYGSFMNIISVHKVIII